MVHSEPLALNSVAKPVPLSSSKEERKSTRNPCTQGVGGREQEATFWDANAAGSLHALQIQTGPPSYTSKPFYYANLLWYAKEKKVNPKINWAGISINRLHLSVFLF